MSSLGNDAYCGTLNCNKLVAKNPTPSDPHKITGDLEVTGNLTVDGTETVTGQITCQNIITCEGGITVTAFNAGAPYPGISFNDLTQTWDFSADANGNIIGLGHIVNGAGSGAVVTEYQFYPATGTFTAKLPTLILVGCPTASAGLASGTVWSNAGVLNIIP